MILASCSYLVGQSEKLELVEAKWANTGAVRGVLSVCFAIVACDCDYVEDVDFSVCVQVCFRVP